MLVQDAPDSASLRSVLDTVFAAPVYRWADEPGPLRFLREWWRSLGDWLSGLRAGNPAIFRVLITLLLVALLVLLLHAAWVVWETVRGAAGPGADPAAVEGREDHDAEWYYREADRAAAAGRIVDALQLAFVGVALTLDAQGLLHYHPSKTPAECSREANLAGGDRERLRELVRSLYAYVFGGRPCAAADYRRWREAGAMSWNAPAN
jgi:hypothetical protein